jgi:hypothetical protein
MKYEFHLTARNPRLVRTLNYGIETFFLSQGDNVCSVQ